MVCSRLALQKAYLNDEIQKPRLGEHHQNPRSPEPCTTVHLQRTMCAIKEETPIREGVNAGITGHPLTARRTLSSQ